MSIRTFLPPLVAIVLMTLTGGCKKHAEPTEAAKPNVQGDQVTLPANDPQLNSLAVQPVKVSCGSVLQLNGRLIWNDDVTVRVFTAFAGRVTKLLTEVGEPVEIGQALALVASTDFGQAQADARRAATDYILADRNLTRLRELNSHGAASLKDLQSAEADFARASSEKQRSESRLSLYWSDTNSFDQIYTLKSPLKGVVVERNINPGQEVRPDQMLANAPQLFQPLFVVTDPARLWVLIDVTEQDLAHLKPGKSLIIRSHAYPDRTFPGTLDLVSDSLDPSTHTVKVRGHVENADRALKAEMYVTVELADGGQAGVDVPAKAVFRKEDHDFVFVEQNPGQFRRRAVELGPERNGVIQVIKGLEPGQRIVCEGCLLLQALIESEGSS